MIDDVLEDRNPRAALRIRGRTISSARWTRAGNCRPAPLLPAGHARVELERIVELALRYLGLPRSARIRGDIADLRWFGTAHVGVVDDVLEDRDPARSRDEVGHRRQRRPVHGRERTTVQAEARAALEPPLARHGDRPVAGRPRPRLAP